jgi:hypothetical protein
MIYLQILWIRISLMGGLLFGNPYSKAWDKKLNELLDEYPIKFTSPHYVTLGDVNVWISNRWYTYAHPYASKLPERRPSIRTMIRLNAEIEKQLFK